MKGLAVVISNKLHKVLFLWDLHFTLCPILPSFDKKEIAPHNQCYKRKPLVMPWRGTLLSFTHITQTVLQGINFWHLLKPDFTCLRKFAVMIFQDMLHMYNPEGEGNCGVFLFSWNGVGWGKAERQGHPVKFTAYGSALTKKSDH